MPWNSYLLPIVDSVIPRGHAIWSRHDIMKIISGSLSKYILSPVHHVSYTLKPIPSRCGSRHFERHCQIKSIYWCRFIHTHIGVHWLSQCDLYLEIHTCALSTRSFWGAMSHKVDRILQQTNRIHPYTYWHLLIISMRFYPETHTCLLFI